MLGSFFQSGRKSQHFAFVVTGLCKHANEAWLALGQGTGLVDDERPYFFKTLQSFGVLIRTPACAPRPVAVMIDIGVASPSAQGHAMIRTATAAMRA